VSRPIPETLRAALTLAELGWYVLPILPGQKRPPFRTGKGHADGASRDVQKLVEWFDEPSSYQLGIVLHLSGLVAVDVDQRPGNHALEEAARLETLSGAVWRSTAWETTPKGGYHYIYSVPAGCDPQALGTILAPGVELQHNILVVAPSRGRRWGRRPEEGIMKLPAALLEIVAPASRAPIPPSSAAPPGSRIYSLASWLRSRPEGDRNKSLYWAACRAGEAIATGIATLSEAAILIDAGVAIGLDPNEAAQTWRNGLRANGIQLEQTAQSAKQSDPPPLQPPPLSMVPGEGVGDEQTAKPLEHIAKSAKDIEQSWAGVDLEPGWAEPGPRDVIITRDGIGQIRPFD
jgi:hypothetical protein